jgi:hypothetical protein
LSDYLSPDEVRAIFSSRYLWMSSNAIVARRDAIVEVGGFIEAQQWHSDWFTFYAIGFRYGVCPIPEGLGVIRENLGGYSDAGMRDFSRQKHVLRAIVAAACCEPNRDLRSIFRSCPAALSVFGHQMARILVASPQYWDIAFPYWLFLLRRAKRNSGLSWPGTIGYAIKKALV